MRATLSDIARQVGVSKSLVSMYLNNHQLSSKIAAETKRKIDQAVKELDYKPSFAARALSNGKTRTIGMVCGGIKNPYFANLVEDAQEQAVRKGYQLLLGLTRWIPEEEKETVKNLLNRQIDGMICCIHPEENSETGKLLLESRIPVIRLSPSHDFPAIYADGSDAMEQAVAFLTGRGHSRIGGIFFKYSEWPTFFTEACRKNQVEANLCFSNIPLLEQYVDSFQKQNISALIVNGVYPLLATLEHHPQYQPEIIVGCDDYTMYSSLDRIVGGIYTDSRLQIQTAVTLLIDKLEDSTCEIPLKNTIYSRFISREEIELRQKRCFGVLTPFPINEWKG